MPFRSVQVTVLVLLTFGIYYAFAQDAASKAGRVADVGALSTQEIEEQLQVRKSTIAMPK